MTTENDILVAIAEAREDAAIEGREKGLAEGRSEGLAEGLEKGKSEGKAESAREIAGKMKSSGISVDDIVKYTGLSMAEVEAL